MLPPSMRPLFVLVLLAAGPVWAQSTWSGSALASWSTSSGHPIRERYEKGSYGLLASGYRQFTPAFGLGVDLGYGRYGAGSFERGPQPACVSPNCTEPGTVESSGSTVRTVLQVSLGARLRRTEGLLRPRVGLSLGAYVLYGSESSVDVYRNAAGGVVRTDPHQGSGNRGGGPGAGLTLGLDVLPFGSRHAFSAEVRLHRLITGYSGGFYWASIYQAGLGYTFW
jgi:hypothetical protein